MAAKSSIRDTARVLDLPLDEAGKIAKHGTRYDFFKKTINFDDKQLKQKVTSDQFTSKETYIII